MLIPNITIQDLTFPETASLHIFACSGCWDVATTNISHLIISDDHIWSYLINLNCNIYQPAVHIRQFMAIPWQWRVSSSGIGGVLRIIGGPTCQYEANAWLPLVWKSMTIDEIWDSFHIISLSFSKIGCGNSLGWDWKSNWRGKKYSRFHAIPNLFAKWQSCLSKMKKTLLCSHHHFQLLTGDVKHYCSLQYQKRKAHHVKNILYEWRTRRLHLHCKDTPQIRRIQLGLQQVTHECTSYISGGFVQWGYL